MAARHRKRPAPVGSSRLNRLPATIIALIGVGLLLYPSAASWFSARQHADSLESYATAVARLPDAQREALLARAHAYNDDLGTQTLRDPYATDGGVDEDDAADYDAQLRLDGSDTMATIRIPSVHIVLPIRHGTAAATLDQGVGHLLGSSLPVGGSGTNAVLTGHSGLANASMFTPLHQVRQGDRVDIDVLGEQLVYRVVQIETVLPTETDLLSAVPGHDYLTLITCTPIGVNSHRLVIRAERVAADDLPAANAALTEDGVPFPWWIVAAVAVGLGTIGNLARRGRR